ncbi:putative xanthine dehydrogenase subunit A [Oceanobacillus oncorhynchi subsp. incaldanensis]|uniref:XdhC family protein n=1 Tax=Oceanobacillus oncorhynchi TaxID=545501 RepID=UPI001B050D30|nr:XdhC/CoxI family protein [Oceanobacillus oncorhynchi]GIO19557.1 putative xanthine dehydrogenase subunit A [Oceanobacillus oncorhynchi subsp. incaldanensis]
MLAKHIESCVKQNKKGVLATIIAKEGSSYRQVGAKSVILEDGIIHGVLSGGCIEEDLTEHAKDVFLTKKPKKVFYDLKNDEDTPWGMGVGCNGAITIWLGLIDPLGNRMEAIKILEALNNQYDGVDPFFVGTVISSDYEEILPLNTFLTLENVHFEKKGILENFRYSVNGKLVNTTIFIEKVDPIPNVVIFGSGQDAQAVVKQIKQLHWQVTVVDHRPGYLVEANFPSADQFQLVKRGEFPNTISFNHNTFIVLMTHHFENDLNYLKGLLQKSIPYIGLLGPQKRYLQLKERLRKEGITISEEVENRIYTPIGLDIGSETPEEIALSIAAEIMSRRNLASNNSLRYKETPIHS